MSVTVGQRLRAGTGTWKGSPTSYTYQWRKGNEWGDVSSFADIAGETGPTYLVASADKEKTIKCAVTATNDFGPGVSDGPVFIVADGRSDFNRTFGYGPAGVVKGNNECVVAAYAAASPGSRCAIFIHGGGFHQQPTNEEPAPGEKTTPEESEKVKAMTCRTFCKPFRELGYAVFDVNFRQDDATHPSFGTANWDIWRAVLWVKANAELFNGDPSKICLIGGSSGGTTAMWLATRANAMHPGTVKAVAALSGEGSLADLVKESVTEKEAGSPPPRVATHFENMAQYFGIPQATLETSGWVDAHPEWKAIMDSVSAVPYIGASMCPLTYYISENEKGGTPILQGTRLKETCEAKGVLSKLTYTIEPGEAHGFSIWSNTVKNAIDTFFKAV